MGKEITIESLQKENEHLKEDLDILKEEATKINKGLEKDNESLKSDVELLNEEIAEIKKSGKSSKKETPAKVETPKEKGYTQMGDLPKFKEQAIKNAPKRNKN